MNSRVLQMEAIARARLLRRFAEKPADDEHDVDAKAALMADILYGLYGKHAFAEDAQGHEHAPVGSDKAGQFVSKGGSGASKTKGQPSSTKTPSSPDKTSDPSKSKFVGQIVGHKEKTKADAIEKEVAAAVAGQWEEDSKPYDAKTKDNKHFFEVKSKLSGKKQDISVHDDALLRKVNLMSENPGATFHTIVVDERDNWDGGKFSEHYSGNRMYYKRGSGRYRPSQMHPVKNAAELKRLIRMTDDELPEAARGSLPGGEEIERLTKAAEAAHVSRLRKDRVRKERLKAQGKSAYQRQT